jgi:penicillin-insensitive murein endopeptidase
MNKLNLLIGLISVSFFYSSVNAEEIRGFYSQGSMRNIDSVLDHDHTIQKLFRSRGMHYTSSQMRDLLEDLNLHLKNIYPDVEILQVGDLSARHGGKIPRHASHQNGLDADVVYLRNNRKVQEIHAPEWIEDFINGTHVSTNFETQRNWQAFQYLVENYPIGRIFVDQVVKAHLCQYVSRAGLMQNPLARETLRRLRGAALHRTHFHIRLKCPADQPTCEEQFEPPAGHGCSEVELAQLDLAPSC